MDQIKVGRFIADMRKEQSLTQKQLAESLGLSDKAVSKWECGKSMPDTAILLDLCQLLKINVNELLSGEKLSLETYHGKAEENMLHLMHETEKARSKRKWSFISAILGIGAFLFFLLLLLVASNATLIWFLDTPTLISIVGFTFIILISSGATKDLSFAFTLCFKKNVIYTTEQLKNAIAALKLTFSSILLAGGISFFIGLISFSAQLKDFSYAPPNLAVASLSLLYSFILALIILPLQKRLESVLNEGDTL